jgi:hypothetical protein
MAKKNTAQSGVGEIEIVILGEYCLFDPEKCGNDIRNTHPG